MTRRRFIPVPLLRPLAAVGMTAMCLGGCTRRTIEITSEPSGALVWLNDVEVGRTPLEVDFKWYGVYDVRLKREGCEPLWTSQEAVAPWYEYPGPDLFAAAASPHIVLKWHFDLKPLEETADSAGAEAALLDRARGVRTRASAAAEETKPASEQP